MNKWILIALAFTGLISQNCKTLSSSSSKRTLNISEQMRSGRDVMVNGATISENITLEDLITKDEHVIIAGAIKFENCTFEGLIDLRPSEGGHLTFAKQVIFHGCTFNNGVVLNDAIFDGRFQLEDCLIEGSLDLQRNTFRHRCRLDKNAIGQDLILQYSRFMHELSIFESNAGRHFSLQGISVAGQCQLSSSTIGDALVLSAAYFHETFMANYLKVGKKLLSGNSRFNGRADFIDIQCSDFIKFGKSEFIGKMRMSVKSGSPVLDIDDCFFLQDESIKM